MVPLPSHGCDLNTALIIWGIFHILNMLAYAFNMKDSNKGFYISLSAISLMGGSALMWTGQTSWFLGLNLAIVGTFLVAAFALLGVSPPSPKNHEASTIAAVATIRLAIALACWFLTK